MGNSSEPPSPQSTKTNQRRACSSADLFFSALQRPAAGGQGCRSASGATKSRRERDYCNAVSFKLFARAPPARRNGCGARSAANPSTPLPARFKRRVWKSYRVSPNFRPTASEIIRKVESCMSVSPFSRRATYSLFLPILSASCC